MTLAIVILAGGDQVIPNSRRPKLLHLVGGKPLLSHAIAAAAEIADPANIFVLTSEQVESALSSAGVTFLSRPENSSLALALQSHQEAFAGYADLLLLPGDLPLITAKTLESIMKTHREASAAMTVVIESGSSGAGVLAVRTNTLLAHLAELAGASSTVDLNDLNGLARNFSSANDPVSTLLAPDREELHPLNSLADLAILDARLRARTAARLMAEGVTILRPDTCVIDDGVEVGPDTVIEPYVQLLGLTRIGSDCFIRSSSVIENSTIADQVLIRQSCIVSESTIASGAKIGPFAHLRPGSEIGEEAHVGNFVETKKARLGKGAKANHLTYLGDAEIGAGTNIGAGVITCNYDGVHKHTTRIGEGAFIGSDSTLVAPITIGNGAYIGAGSCITREVPSGALAVGRSRQVTKEGWATAKRSKQQRESC